MSTFKQPGEIPPPSLRASDEAASPRAAGGRIARVLEKVTTRHGWLGDYDYAWLCTPALPCFSGGRRRRNVQPPFYALDQELPLLLAMTTGLQHSLAMLAGACL